MKGVLQGVLAAVFMFLLYFGLLVFANSWSHAVTQTLQNLPFIILLVVGFGFQVALFFHVREFAEASDNAEVVGSGVASVGSMAACCAHHLVDLGLLVGLSGVVALIAQFQTAFFVLAIASNLYGIVSMLVMIKKFELFEQGSWLQGVSLALPDNGKQLVLGASAFIVPLFFVLPLLVVPTVSAGYANLSEKSVSVNDVVLKAKPLLQGDTLALEVALDTHSGDLVVDLERQAFVTSSDGKRYFGKWSGSPVGGHHRSGVLIFTGFSGELASFYVESLNGAPGFISWP